MSHLLSPREAAQAWGMSRATIQRHVTAGKLSVTRDADGRQHIDPAELQRVYGPPKASASRPDEASPGATLETTRIAVLETKVAMLTDLVRSKDENLADMRAQVQRLTHDGGPAQGRRRWWPWGKA